MMMMILAVDVLFLSCDWCSDENDGGGVDTVADTNCHISTELNSLNG